MRVWGLTVVGVGGGEGRSADVLWEFNRNFLKVPKSQFLGVAIYPMNE